MTTQDHQTETTDSTGEVESSTAGTDSPTVQTESPAAGTDSSTAGTESLTAGTDSSTAGTDSSTAGTESLTAGTDSSTAGTDSSTAGCESSAVGTDSSTERSLFAEDELSGLRSRWDDVQSGFVDDPRECVQKADGLVSDVVNQLTTGFSEARSRLEAQWARGEEASTEDLRLALKRYREFFERLLAI
jgi:hypothetical protein